MDDLRYRYFTWRGDTLHRYGSAKPVALIERDIAHPTMWRIRRPDGHASDLFNRSRAKDNAIKLAMQGCPKKAVLAPLVEPQSRAGISLASS